jgi:hypothetical protein
VYSLICFLSYAESRPTLKGHEHERGTSFFGEENQQKGDFFRRREGNKRWRI